MSCVTLAFKDTNGGLKSLAFLYISFTMTDLAVNYDYLEASLCNTSGKVPLAERFRTLFTLKNIADDRSIEIIGKGNKNIQKAHINILYIIALKDDSELLKHELAYCLGQIGNPKANPVLINVLEDLNEHEMVRHEVSFIVQ